jgi:hypothetical protein
MTEIGPVQVLAISFGPEATFEGHIIEELARLDGLGTIRVLDLLFIRKDASGDLLALDVQGEDLGAIVGALLGFEFEPDGSEPARHHPGQVGEGAFGLTKADLESMAADLEPDHAGAVLLIEHVWARDLKRAIRDHGGVPIAEGFLTPELLAEVGAELVAVSAAIDEDQAAAGVA